jgi:hypothetical protein
MAALLTLIGLIIFVIGIRLVQGWLRTDGSYRQKMLGVNVNLESMIPGVT